MTTARIIIQSRLSSSRLPGKALLPIRGLPTVVLAAKRAGTAGIPVVVATSEEPADDLLVEELERHGVPYHRGSLENVLDRFVQATADMPDDGTVVRLTADNVFPDGAFIREMLNTYHRHAADYLGTRSPQDGLPYGVSAEIFSIRALRVAAQQAAVPADFEHVTPWMLRECDCRLYRPTLERSYGHLRATIDRMDDYLRVREVFRSVDDPVRVPWRVLCDALAAHPDSPAYRVPWKERGGRLHGEMALGTAQLGMRYGAANTTGQPSPEEAKQLLRRAAAHGVTAIDCASAYGTAELVVGEALGAEYRDAAHIITKLDPMPGLAGDISSSMAAGAIAELSVYRSLQRLQRPKLDTLLLHRWSHRTAFGGAIWAVLPRLKAEGLIGKLGASVYSVADALEALDDPSVEHIQLPLNLLDWRWRSEAFLAAVEKRPDVVMHVRSAYLQGLLVGPRECWPKLDHVDPDSYIRSLETLANELGRHNRADLCIAYVRSHPWVTSIVVGVETIMQLDESMGHFLRPALTQEEREYVDRSLPKAPVELLDPSQWPRAGEQS